MRSLFVTPILPATGWGGLALRARHWVHHLRRLGPVEVVVVPVAGQITAPAARHALRRLDGVTLTELPLPGDDELLRRGVRLLADPVARELLVACDPLPLTARAAPMWLADELVGHPSGTHPHSGEPRPTPRLPSVDAQLVVAFRDATGLLAEAIARRLGVPLVVDLDDDEGALLRDAASPEAAAHDRLVAALTTRAALLTVANPHDAVAVARRHGATVVTVPNAVIRPARTADGRRDADSHDSADSAATGTGVGVGVDTAAPRPSSVRRRTRALFVGNFTYAPNVEGLDWFADEVAPHVGSRLTVDVVGSGSQDAVRDAWERHDHRSPGRVRLRALGRVTDAALERHYRAADIVVAPLRQGSGTRLKVLEAFARDRPVVATSIAVHGLDVVDGRDALIEDDPRAFAAAVDRVLGDGPLRTRLAAAASSLVDRYELETITAQVAQLLASVAEEPRPQGDTMPTS